MPTDASRLLLGYDFVTDDNAGNARVPYPVFDTGQVGPANNVALAALRRIWPAGSDLRKAYSVPESFQERDINGLTVRFESDASRPVSFGITLIRGGLWSGTQTSVNTSVAVKPSYRLRFSLGLQRTDASLGAPVGDFVTSVWTARANYSFSTNMFVDSLVQYLADRRLFNANVRFNLIHRPLSDIYVVWNEERFTDATAPTPGRGFIVKYTHMFAF